MASPPLFRLCSRDAWSMAVWRPSWSRKWAAIMAVSWSSRGGETSSRTQRRRKAAGNCRSPLLVITTKGKAWQRTRPSRTGAVPPGSSVSTRARPLLVAGADQLRDGVGAVLQDVEEVVGQVDVALVQLVDEQHPRQLVPQRGGAQRTQADEVPDPGAAPPSPNASPDASDGSPGEPNAGPGAGATGRG